MLNELTRLKEIESLPIFAEMKGIFIGGGHYFEENGELTLRELHEKNPTWAVEDMLYGLNGLAEISQNGQYVYSVYSREEVEKDPEKENVKLVYLPAEKKSDRFAILCAGGAYGAVCTMVESLPVAVRLRELGISCFCLNYRVGPRKDFQTGLLPLPIDDLAAALKFIRNHRKTFGYSLENYAAGGFSAGGHLASLWGTEALGAPSYGLPLPKCLMLCYPLISMSLVEDGPVRQYMRLGLFGKNNPNGETQFDTSMHITPSYPKTVLVRSLDDTTVSVAQGDLLLEKLKENGVPSLLLQAEHGGHGFGHGSLTSLSGWEEKAVSFWEEK